MIRRKVNDDKTQLIVLFSEHNVDTFVEQNVQVGVTKGKTSSRTKNLGIFEKSSMSGSVNHLKGKKCYEHVHNVTCL